MLDHAHINSTETVYRTVVNITCHYGYIFSKHNITSLYVRCKDGAQWNSKLTQCIRRYLVTLSRHYDCYLYHVLIAVNISFHPLTGLTQCSNVIIQLANAVLEIIMRRKVIGH